MREGIFKKIINSKSKTFLAFCFCFVIGVALASYIDLDRLFLFYFYLLSFIFLSLIILFWNKKRFRLILFFLLFINLGIMRLMLAQPIINENHISYYNDQQVEFNGWVSEEPDVRIGYVNYVMKVSSVVGVQNLEPIRGKILLKTKLYPRYKYGDQLKIKCNLKTPENFDEKFKYDKYLSRYGIYSICQYSVISTLPPPLNPPLWQGGKVTILQIKSVVADKIDQLWPEPQSSFMAGLLYGSRSGLPEEISENFNRTGITHIIAISGYNISIIVIFLMAILIAIGLYRQQAFWVTLLGIFIFVIFTGASASVVRAGIMGSLVLLGQYMGRLSRVGNMMMLALVLMLLINPHVLLWDAGFQLSFLATLGLVYISPVLSDWGKGVLKYTPTSLIETIIATLSAIIATLPLILYQFGRLSIVAPLANILVLWIIPWLMLFGFLSVIMSFIFLPLAQIIAWLSGLGLDYVIGLANWFGGQNWVSVNLSWSWWMVVIAYLLLGVVLHRNKL